MPHPFLATLTEDLPADTHYTVTVLMNDHGSLAWALTCGNDLVTWDGWYSLVDEHNLEPLDTVANTGDDVLLACASQLGRALLFANLPIHLGLVNSFRFQLSLPNRETVPPYEVAMLKRARVVAWLNLGELTLAPYPEPQL
jgi:hypothetical protein